MLTVTCALGGEAVFAPCRCVFVHPLWEMTSLGPIAIRQRAAKESARMSDRPETGLSLMWPCSLRRIPGGVRDRGSDSIQESGLIHAGARGEGSNNRFPFVSVAIQR